MSLARTIGAWVWLACIACAGNVADSASDWPVAQTALELTEVDWNPGHVELGNIAAISEDADQLVVFGERGATLIAGGAAAGGDAMITNWLSASRIPAADGSGFWPVGVDAAGAVYRLRAGTALENVSDRYGLLDDQVTRVAPMGISYVAFALQDGLAVADGLRVTRYPARSGGARCLTGDAHRAAFSSGDGRMHILDVDSRELITLPLEAAQSCAFMRGQLWIQTPSSLYVQIADELQPVFHASAIAGLAVSAERLWFARGEQLCTADPDAKQIACGRANGLGSGAALLGSASGDVWALRAGKLARYALPAHGDEAEWRTAAFSVYARVCSACHAPGGSSGIDLSTYAAWQSRRDKIIARVIEAKNMPPDRALSEQDRASIAAWAGQR